MSEDRCNTLLLRRLLLLLLLQWLNDAPNTVESLRFDVVVVVIAVMLGVGNDVRRVVGINLNLTDDEGDCAVTDNGGGGGGGGDDDDDDDDDEEEEEYAVMGRGVDGNLRICRAANDDNNWGVKDESIRGIDVEYECGGCGGGVGGGGGVATNTNFCVDDADLSSTSTGNIGVGTADNSQDGTAIDSFHCIIDSPIC